jgi:hypothetical protein
MGAWRSVDLGLHAIQITHPTWCTTLIYPSCLGLCNAIFIVAIYAIYTMATAYFYHPLILRCTISVNFAKLAWRLHYHHVLLSESQEKRNAEIKTGDGWQRHGGRAHD